MVSSKFWRKANYYTNSEGADQRLIHPSDAADLLNTISGKSQHYLRRHKYVIKLTV